MDRAQRDTHKKQSKRKKGRILRRFRRFFKKLFVGDSTPKEYRPYLGQAADQHEVEEKSYENTRASLKKYTKKRAPRKRFKLPDWGERWSRYKERRIKRKYKNKIRRKHRRKQRKRARIEFIRKFIPQYKKDDQVSPEITHIENVEDKDKGKIKGNWVYTINSTVVFIIAYLLMFMTYQLTVLITASRWKLDSVLYYFDLAFNDYSPLWNRLNIVLITLSGPLISLVLAAVFMRVLVPRFNDHKTIKLLFLWLAIHGYNFFLGAFASGVSFDEGFGYVPAWLFMNTFWKIFLSLIFLFILGMIGYYSAPKFLETSYSLIRVRQQNRIKFLFFQVVLPWLFGILLIYLLKMPNNMNYDTANLFTLVFAVVPVLFNRSAKPSKNFKSLKKPSRIRWVFVVLLVLLMVAYRVGLNEGLHVKLYYRFIFSLDITPL